MNQYLARIEHRPPVGETMVRHATLKVVSHEAIGQLRARPIIFQVAVLASPPLQTRGIVTLSVRRIVGYEEATAVGFAGRTALWGVALNSIRRHRTGLARSLDGR